MTTIASDGITVAYDSRLTVDGIVFTDSAQKRTIKNGLYFVGCGQDPACIKLIDGYLSGQPVSPDLECQVAMSKGDGKLVLIYPTETGYDEYDILTSSSKFAMGSGESFALAALDFGKGAVEAVKYAATRDLYTGGKIISFKLSR